MTTYNMTTYQKIIEFLERRERERREQCINVLEETEGEEDELYCCYTAKLEEVNDIKNILLTMGEEEFSNDTK